MKKYISLIMSLFICFSFVPSCFAANTNQFVFRDGITWGMSVDDVRRIEGSEDNIENLLGAKYMSYFDISVSKYDSCELQYIFIDNILCAAEYIIRPGKGEVASASEYIIKGLTMKYGNPAIFTEKTAQRFLAPELSETELGLPVNNLSEIIEEFNNSKSLWELKDGTLIFCDKVVSDDVPSLMIYYISDNLVGNINTDGL